MKDDISESFSQHVGLSKKGTVVSRIFQAKGKSKMALNGTTREKVTFKKTKAELQGDGTNSACSVPTEIGYEDNPNPSLFERPGLGSFIFLNNIKPSLDAVSNGRDDVDSIGTARSLAVRLNTFHSDTYDDDEEDSESSALELFLEAHDLNEILPKLTQERIDTGALLILEEKDFDAIGFPLGVKRKLLAAIKERKECLENSTILVDNHL